MKTSLLGLILIMATLALASCSTFMGINTSSDYKKGNIQIVTYAPLVEGKKLVWGRTAPFGAAWDIQSVSLQVANDAYKAGYHDCYILVEQLSQGAMSHSENDTLVLGTSSNFRIAIFKD